MAPTNRTPRPNRRKPLAGTFNKLTVIGLDMERSPPGSPGKQFWLCRCECGRVVSVYRSHLKSGHTKSCGCHNLAVVRERSTKHGHAQRADTRTEYNIWANIQARCTNSSVPHFHMYGGRGVCLCLGFRDFAHFLSVVGPRPSREYTLDRIENDKHYSCGACVHCQENWWGLNVRWATRHQQAVNTRRRNTIEYHGRHQTIAEWAEEYGLTRSQLKVRLKNGWPLGEALTTPTITPGKKRERPRG